MIKTCIKPTLKLLKNHALLKIENHQKHQQHQAYGMGALRIKWVVKKNPLSKHGLKLSKHHALYPINK